MTPEDISFIYKHAAAYGVAGIVGLGLVYLIARHAIGGYLGEKGKNLATREDLAHLTKIVEDVKAPYAQLQEELKARHQLPTCRDRPQAPGPSGSFPALARNHGRRAYQWSRPSRPEVPDMVGSELPLR